VKREILSSGAQASILRSSASFPQKAKKGIFITTSTFSKDATEYVEGVETKVILIDGEQLTALMFDYGVGVSTMNTYVVKRIDSDFFEDESVPEAASETETEAK
jgi:restriction endonuclease Mrr